jgi:hypothetical protein
MDNPFKQLSTTMLIREIDYWNRGEVWAYNQEQINLIIDELVRRFPLKKGALNER